MTTPQKRAVQTYRHRLHAKGMARFDVLGLDTDRGLIRSLARRLAEEGVEATHLRVEMVRSLATPSAAKGGILAALRRSPLLGVDLEIERDPTPGRDMNF